MKSRYSILIICLVFGFISCQKIQKQEIYFHKSHEESRKKAPFSDATQVGNLYFLTGQIGKNHQTGKMAEGGIEAETAQVLKNIEAVLKNHNMTLKDVVKWTVILADMDDFSKMNSVYTTFFVDNLPARTTFAANLVAGAKIEIEVIAAKSKMDTHTQELVNKGIMLPLMEEFYTIQGEGYHTGKAAYFIRVGGCDVGCHWCDVKESWNADLHPPTLAETIVENAKKYSNTVVITGGEPLMWSMDYITKLLQENNIKTHIETSGAYSFLENGIGFCLSPKKTKLPLEEVYPEADELKMIIHNKNDFDFAEQQATKVSEKCELFYNLNGVKRKMTPEIVDYVMKNPKWKISLQTHKYLNIP